MENIFLNRGPYYVTKNSRRKRPCRVKNWTGYLLYMGKTLVTEKHSSKEIFTRRKTRQKKQEATIGIEIIYSMEILSVGQNNFEKSESFEGELYVTENDSCWTIR